MKSQASPWRPLKDDPKDGKSRLYGWYCTRKRDGKRFFEVQYLYVDDDGTLCENTGEPYEDWQYFDFDFFMDITPPPDPSNAPKARNKR